MIETGMAEQAKTIIEQAVAAYYGDKIRTYGTEPKGVDWKDAASQHLRFAQLIKLFDSKVGGSVTDYGCGYGEFLLFLRQARIEFEYLGIDVSEEMIAAASQYCRDIPNAAFAYGSSPARVNDYAVASGIFNVRLDFDDQAWLDYIISTLDNMNLHSRRGFAFNCLTKYSDPHLMRRDLYYCDPLLIFDHCKMTYSRNVALLHDYDLYEFTVIVRKPKI